MATSLADDVAALTTAVSSHRGAWEERALQAISALSERHGQFGVLNGWFAAGRDVFARRAASFALSKRGEGLDREGWFLLLCILDTNDDRATTINAVTAIEESVRRGRGLPRSLAAFLPPFLIRNARSRDPLLSSAADDLVVVGCDSGAITEWLSATQLRELNEALASDRDEETRAGLAAVTPRPVELSADELREWRADFCARTWASSEVERAAVEALDDRIRLLELGRGSAREGKVVQSIHISPLKNERPKMTVVSTVVDHWTRLYEEFSDAWLNVEVSLLPIAAREGSFILDLAVVAADPTDGVFDAITKVVRQANTPETLASALAEIPIDIGATRALFSTVSDADVDVEVTAADASRCEWHRSFRIDAKTARGASVTLATYTTEYLDSIQVPQADKLSKVILLLELIHEGRTVTPESLGVVKRQVAYYKHAARILGVLDQAAALTAAGTRVVDLEAQMRLVFLGVLFEASDVGAAWIHWSKGATLVDVKPESATEFLNAVARLSPITAGRRASTLTAWHGEFMPYHYSKWMLPKKPVRP